MFQRHSWEVFVLMRNNRILGEKIVDRNATNDGCSDQEYATPELTSIFSSSWVWVPAQLLEYLEAPPAQNLHTFYLLA